MATLLPFPGNRPEAVLPENVEAEKAFLGAVLIDNRLLETKGALRPEHFFAPIHRKIFERLEALRERGQVVTPVTLGPHFKLDEELKDLGGTSYLARLTADGQGLLNTGELAAQIIELAKRRKIIALGQELIDAAGDTSTLHSGKLLADAADRIAGLERQSDSDDYPVLLASELLALPDPIALIDDFLFANTFGALYAEPKAFKSFAAVDLALHLAHGINWCGLVTRRTGVLYIAGEGLTGLKQRVRGWHKHHELNIDDAHFAAVPVAVELLEPRNQHRLARAINLAATKFGASLGLVIVDTLSRAIPGVDENSAQSMSLVVTACDDIRRRTGCTILAVHHAGKDKGRGMRGSSVALGGMDTVIRADRTGRSLTLVVEDQKDCHEAAPFCFEMETVELEGANGKRLSTLVPVPTVVQIPTVEAITAVQIGLAFDLIEERWLDGQPLSQSPNTKRDGRFAAKILASKFGGSVDQWRELITSWLESRCLEIGVANSSTKLKGLRVLRRPLDER